MKKKIFKILDNNFKILNQYKYNEEYEYVDEICDLLDGIDAHINKYYDYQHSFNYFLKNYYNFYEKIEFITNETDLDLIKNKIFFFDLDEIEISFYKKYLTTLIDEKIILKHLFNIIDTIPINKICEKEVINFLEPFKGILEGKP